MVNVDVCVLSHIKKELAWAIAKWLWVIGTLKNNKSTKELKRIKELSHFKFRTMLYTLLCGPY